MTMKSLFSCLAALLFVLISQQAVAKGDAQSGEQKSQVCQACHGSDGNGTDPSYPKLAGQYQDYLAKALADYRSGDRNNAVMAAFAQALTDQDIDDLAAFYASLPGLVDLRIK